MTALWEPGTYYGAGSIVVYEGHKYKIIQPHSSQADWTPPATPALWGRMEEGCGDEPRHHGGYNPEYASPPVPEKQQPQPQHHEGSSGDHHGEKIHDEERKKNWWDLDDDRKKKLEIGGGLLAGAAVLTGGYFAFKEHEKNEEEKKALTWALQNWLHDAQARTADFRQNGPRGPATWVLTEGKHIPPNAIVVGPEHSWILYICRAFHDGGIQVGKASDAFKKGAVIGYGHKEIHLGTYEILVGDMRGLTWVNVHGRLNVAALGKRPVEGGREEDGTPLYVAKAPHRGAVHPGKASEKLDAAFIPYDGTEVAVKDYQVLCYA